ncbi:MAG: hypothetical protein MK110_16990 [Fuerstiella sp.]|nr:hypothetical protein [Fuerstiella sp.]
MTTSMNVLLLVRDEHRYVFLYDDNSVEEVLSRLSASASDPELEFSWWDAAMLSQRVRKMAEERELNTGDSWNAA